MQFKDVLAEVDYDAHTRAALQSVIRYRTFLGVPILLDGKPIGGKGLALLNVDYRFPLVGALGGTVFVDAGNVWADWRDVNLQEIKPGAGLGVRHLTGEQQHLAAHCLRAGQERQPVVLLGQRDRGVEVRGRDLMSGLPRELRLGDEEVREAIAAPLADIMAAVHATLEETPPELAADITKEGIFLAGGGALLRGLDVLPGVRLDEVVRRGYLTFLGARAADWDRLRRGQRALGGPTAIQELYGLMGLARKYCSRDLCRALRGAILQENPELIAAKPRDGIAGADPRLQDTCDLFQQPVTRLMATCVIDQFELIEIQIQQDVRRQAHDIFEVVGHEDQRHLQRPAQAVDLVLKTSANLAIDLGERLVQEQEVWLVQERTRERESLDHATRVDPNRPLAGVLEPGPGEEVAYTVGGAVDPEQARLERQVLGTAQVRIAEALVPEVAEPPPQCGRCDLRVGPEQREAAARRPQQADDQLEQHRLAAAALADHRDRLAVAHRQADVAQHLLGAEPQRRPLEPNQ